MRTQFLILFEQLNVNGRTDLLPRQMQERLLEPTQSPFGCADQIVYGCLSLPHLCQGGFGRDPAIHDPHPIGTAILLLDALEKVR